MDKIEILAKAAAMNVQLLVKACDQYHHASNIDEAIYLQKIVDTLITTRDNLPHGEGYSGIRRSMTWCIENLYNKTLYLKGE